MDESSGRLGATWPTVMEDIITGMEDWRTAHPTATFAEIETEVETRLGELRARMVADAALASAARTGTAGTGERQDCPACGGPLVARGEQVRQVRIRGDRRVALRRTYLTCTRCGRGHIGPG
jgi:RNase P subunit RPR2